MKKHAEELKAKISAKAEELRQGLVPLVNSVRGSQPGNAEDLQKSLAELSSRLDQQVEDFRRTVGPYGETFNKAMVQQLDTLRQKLGPLAGDMEDHLSFLEKDLRDKVSNFFNTLKEKESQARALPAQEEMPVPLGG